jgi:hypothetical protein
MRAALQIAWMSALVLHAGCVLDSRVLVPHDAVDSGPTMRPPSSDAGDAASSVSGMDAAQTDAADPDADVARDADASSDAATVGQCTRHEDCAVDIATCRIGRCNPETSQCEEIVASDCVRCGSDTKVCVNGGCYEGGEFYSQGLDGETLPAEWWTTPERPWTLTVERKVGGDRCAVSGRIGGDAVSELWLSLDDVPPQSWIRFWRRVSSESVYDYLEFTVNGDLLVAWDGAVGWDDVEYEVRASGHVEFVWRYRKDAVLEGGDDSAWIDEVRISRRCGAPTQ